MFEGRPYHAGKSIQRCLYQVQAPFLPNVFQRFATREATLTTVESFCMEGIMAMGEPTIAEFSRMMQISTHNAAYKIDLIRRVVGGDLHHPGKLRNGGLPHGHNALHAKGFHRGQGRLTGGKALEHVR